MDQGFRDYYQRRLDARTRWLDRRDVFSEARRTSDDVTPSNPFVREAALGALSSAQETAARLGLDLRPDAELVLLLFADEIVARPVAATTPWESRQLPEVLRADARTLVVNAEQSANDGEVSAHAVVDSLSRSWGELQSARFRFWDRAGGDPAKPSVGGLEPSGDQDVPGGEDQAGGVG
jgi:hypothetical protein